MTIGAIKKQVRWCLDEESYNGSSLSSGETTKCDDTFMDNIIVAKIGDALRWVVLNAPASLMDVTDSSTSGGITGSTIIRTVTSASGLTVEDYDSTLEIAKVTLPSTISYLKLSRIRVKGWHKAILNPVAEDSDEELEMFDSTARGTQDRPQAAIMQTSPVAFLVQPLSASDKAKLEITVLTDPTAEADSGLPSNTNDTSEVTVPSKLRGAFIYYLAYLVMIAYENTNKATLMLNTAYLQMGLSTKGGTQ